MHTIHSKSGAKDLLFLASLLFLSIYCIVHELPIPSIDDLYFKQAGVNLIRDRGFSATTSKSYYRGSEEGFVEYPPIYPFLCGIWFHIFGISLSASLVLSFLLCGMIVFIQILLFNNLLGKDKPMYIYALMFFSWMLAVSVMDRPDVLLAFFGILLFLIIIKKIGTKLSLGTCTGITVLIGLSLGTSLALGLFMLLYMLFTLLSFVGFNVKKIRLFAIWCILGIIFCVLMWWFPFRKNPALFYYQFFYPASSYLKISLASIIDGILFGLRYGRIQFYFLAEVLLALSVTVNVFLQKNRARRMFFIWQGLGFFIVLLLCAIIVPKKIFYRQFFWQFFVIIGGMSFAWMINYKKIQHLKKLLITLLCFSLSIAYVPFFVKVIILPLTWNERDTYEYNKKIILERIPKNAKVITATNFWYALFEHYEIFDAYFVRSNPPECDYILLASGGGPSPTVPLWREFYEEILLKDFVKEISTMIDEPTQLFGTKILRSRWSYRFELYRRKTR